MLFEPTRGKMIFAFTLFSALVILVQPLNSIPIDEDEVYELEESFDFEDDSYGLLAFAPFPELDDRDDVCNNYNGIGTNNGKVCCARSCGTCGGKGCSKRPGGKKNCCTKWIKKNCGTAPCRNANNNGNSNTGNNGNTNNNNGKGDNSNTGTGNSGSSNGKGDNSNSGTSNSGSSNSNTNNNNSNDNNGNTNTNSG